MYINLKTVLGVIPINKTPLKKTKNCNKVTFKKRKKEKKMDLVTD